MTATEPSAARCPVCGGELVLVIDPQAPTDADATVLSVDPPFRYACGSTDCRHHGL